MSQQQQQPRSGNGGRGPRPRFMSAASSTRVVMPVSYDMMNVVLMILGARLASSRAYVMHDMMAESL